MRKDCLLLTLMSLLFLSAQSQSSDTAFSRKKYFTKPITAPITLDGVPSEEVWNTVDWGGDFIQYQPAEGKAPSQPSAFKILYDEKFLYIAYRCFDSSPDSIIRRLSRRDEFPGDWMEINIDSYHDLRT